MSALEYQFPDPDKAPAAYLEVAVNAFENIVGRWDTTSCGGGLKWQVYPENAYGYNYKNSISNGCAFALGARLARYTGDKKYADWAVKIYDWSKKVGLISDGFEVFDGTDDKTNCNAVSDKTQWSYNNAMYLHGSAFMFDVTSGASVWKDRTAGFLKHAELFFKPYDNATDVMYERACETGATGRHCNLDQQSFKAYLARFIAKTAVMAPFTKDTITKYLKASAVGAAKSCSGGADGATCGSKWYTGGWDGTSGVGQQLSALEVTQALLMVKKGTLPVKMSGDSPRKPPVSDPVSSTKIAQPTSSTKIVQPTSSATVSPEPPKVPEASKIPRKDPTTSPSTSASGAVPTQSPAKGVNENAPTKNPCASCTCSESVTKTVYVTAASSTLTSVSTPTNASLSTTAPSIPLDSSIPAPVMVSSTVLPVAPPPANSSTSTPTGTPEFPGAASGVSATLVSVLGSAALVMAFGLL